MPSKYKMFDTSRLELLPLAQRENIMDVSEVLKVGDAPMEFAHDDLPALADAIVAAKKRNASVVLLIGGHVIKQGLSRYVIDLIRKGVISVVATNGACMVHDYELSLIGATSESVADYIFDGRFGLWKETGQINDFIREGDAAGLGMGESLGKAICESDNPHKDVSIFAAAYEASVPATVHVGIGYDIIHEHPNFDGGATGSASYRDFLIFSKIIENLEGGVVLCLGSAVMGPEVYLKALSISRNVASRQGREIRNFTSAVFDLQRLSDDIHAEAAKDTPEYYYRPYKTVLVRTVRDGGTSYYIRGDHVATVPALHKLAMERLGGDI